MVKQKDAYLKLLKGQLIKIEDRTFDLSSWKKATKVLLESYFGIGSPQAKSIEEIEYAYNSWALRDESGNTNPIKTDCKTILGIIIGELELTETNESHYSSTDTSTDQFDFIWSPLEDELTGSALKKLKTLLLDTSLQPMELEKFLKDLPSQTTINILQNILMAKPFISWLLNKPNK